MSFIEITALFTMMATLAALPSASVALVVTRAATLGLANGIAVAAGIVFGDLVFASLAILGLSIVAETMGGFFMLIKIVGGLYLIWLGISLWRSQSTSFVRSPHTENLQQSLLTSFMSGFVVTLGDVKAIFFYASLFPMFVDLSVLNTMNMITIIAVIILAVGGVKVMYAIFATRIAYFLEHRNLQKASCKAVGGLMVGAGSYLIIKT